MLCENCGENEANIKYTQIVNGVKKEMTLCSKCAEEMGIGIEKLNFNMPINLSSFLGEFIGDVETNFLQGIESETKLCKQCNMTYDDFVNTGKFGCADCYNVFNEQIDLLLKNIQGANRHIGRGLNASNIDNNSKKVTPNTQIKMKKNEEKKENNQLEQLEKELKIAIQEERYEDAAKIRDKIKKLNSK